MMDNKECEQKECKSKKQMQWTAAMDAALIDTFVDAYGQNKKQGKIWDESVYTAVQSAVFTKTQEEVEKSHIVSRMRTMKKEFNSFNDLKSRSGFGWDPIKQTIQAPDASWNDLLSDPKTKEKFKGFRDRGPKWPLDHLAIMFGNSYASGSLTLGGMDSVEQNTFDTVPDLNAASEEINIDDTDDVDFNKVSNKRKSTEDKRKQGKRVKVMDDVKNVVQDIANEMVNLRKTVHPAARAEYVSEQVMKVEGFSKAYLRKAYTILMRDPIEREVFLGGDSEVKKTMLEELREKIGSV